MFNFEVVSGVQLSSKCIILSVPQFRKYIALEMQRLGTSTSRERVCYLPQLYEYFHLDTRSKPASHMWYGLQMATNWQQTAKSKHFNMTSVFEKFATLVLSATLVFET